ncbi:MAG: hypothetical protein AAB426_13445, partial [Myxococcota bacterium]
QRMRQILGGAEGREAADSLRGWENNGELQQKLTEAQKDAFREAMAKDPGQASKASQALNRLTQQPGFQKAVSNSQLAGTLQAGVLKNPAVEKPALEMLQGRFMQAGKSDAQTKNQYLRYGMDRAAQGRLDVVRKTGDMLGTLAKANVGRPAQRAAMNMAQRTDGNAKAMGNVDAFVQDPNVSKLPSFARTKATELLAKAEGKDEVKEGFESLAADKKYKSQTADNKGRFYATIGSGRPSEYRAITDKVLASLESKSFPTRGAQVNSFLGKVAAQVQRQGAASVDGEALIKSAKKSPVPSAPKLTSTEGLDEEEASRARAQNRAKVIQFFTQMQRAYDGADKQLASAKYFEDVNRMTNLREAENIDVTVLSAEDQALVADRQAMLGTRLESLRTRQRERMRELRTKRMPMSKRRAQRAEQRSVGRQPKYFSPTVSRTRANPSAAFTQQAAVGGRPPSLAGTPARNQLQQRQAAGLGAGGIDQQVAQAVAQLGQGPITAAAVNQVAQAIASQVVMQVTEQLSQAVQVQATSAQSTSTAPTTPRQEGKVDGWGIPRTFERDLGGARPSVVKPASAPATGTVTSTDVAAERYTGRMLVKDPGTVRRPDELFGAHWKELTRSEKALLKNLGWSQQDWDTKDNPGAKWPMSMATGFVNLTTVQRESVRKLGYTLHDWDTRVQAFTMGKNA